MDDRLKDLYQMPEGVMPRQAYIEELRYQCEWLEQEITNAPLPPPVSAAPESYIYARDELEFQLVKRALGFAQMTREHRKEIK